MFCFFKQKTAYGMRMSDCSSDVCSSDLPPLLVDHTDAVAGAVEGDAEIGLRIGDRRTQDLQRFRHRRVGVVVREGAVDLREQHLVPAGQPLHQRLDDRAGGAVAAVPDHGERLARPVRSEEHTSELQSLMRISYAVFCLKKKKQRTYNIDDTKLR